MPTIDEKIQATEFTASTSLGFDDVLAVADTVAASAGNFGTSVTRAAVVPGESIEFQITRLGAVGVGVLSVAYAQEDGSARVAFSVPDYLVSQTTMFFIPIGPKESPALPVARTFSEKLKSALAP